MPKRKRNNTSLAVLFANKVVFSKVKSLLEEKQPFDYIIEYLETQGFSVSKGSLSNLKAKIKESETLGIPLDNLIDRRKKTSVKQAKHVSGYTGEPKSFSQTEITESEQEIAPNIAGNIPNINDSQKVSPYIDTSKKFYSNEQILDSIIDKGFKTIQSTEFIDLPLTLKALEMKEKYHQKDSKGLSMTALQQYQIIMEAKLNALSQVVMEFIPEDKQQDAFKEMDKAEQEILHQIEVQEGGKDLLSQIRKAGLDID